MNMGPWLYLLSSLVKLVAKNLDDTAKWIRLAAEVSRLPPPNDRTALVETVLRASEALRIGISQPREN
jgi:hypothetical protein